MFAGVIAVGVGILYALVRFATTVRLRRLRETLSRTLVETRRSEQRLEALEGRLQVERSRRASLREKTETARQHQEERYTRLRQELSPEFRRELKKCRALHPAPDPQAERILHELRLADEIAAKLGSLSLLVVLLPEDETARSSLHSLLVSLLAQRGARFHSPAAAEVVCAFDQPEFGLDLVRQFVDQAPPEHLPGLRGALYTGIHYPPGKSEISRLLLRLVHHAEELAEQAPPGLLLLNEHAHQRLDGQTDLLFFDPAQSLYAFPWTRSAGVAAR